MIDHVFGRDIPRAFIAYENNDPLPIQSLISVNLFSSIPSLSDAQSAVGAISHVTTYRAQSATPYALSYALPAINDPAPSSARQAWQFWEAINYRLTASAQLQTEFRAIVVERAVGGDSDPATTVEDVKAVFPSIGAYVSDSQIEQFLAQAITQMKIDMEGSDLEWAQARKLDRHKLTLAYLVIAMCSESQIVGKNGDVHLARAELYRKYYNGNMKKVTTPYDAAKTGVADEKRNAERAFWTVPR